MNWSTSPSLARAVVTEARLTEIRGAVIARFQRAVEKAKREPLPDVSELTTDVFEQ